jgi:hypothetical protein
MMSEGLINCILNASEGSSRRRFGISEMGAHCT